MSTHMIYPNTTVVASNQMKLWNSDDVACDLQLDTVWSQTVVRRAAVKF